MKTMISTLAITLFLIGAAQAQGDKKETPGNAPTKNMDAVTPEMKGTGTGEHPPTESMDKAVPPMKSGDAPAASGTSGSKMSQADCDAAWKTANPSNAKTITGAQAKVSDMKAADPDNDGTLDQSEFSKACAGGLVSR